MLMSGQAVLMFRTRSTDSGETWGEHSNGCKMMAFTLEDERTAYCIDRGGWLRRTLDGGQNWQVVNQLSIQNGQALAIASTDPTKFLAGGEGVYLSTDSGLSWEERSSGLGASSSRIAVDTKDSSILYLQSRLSYSGNPQPLYRSTDSGTNWELVDEAGDELVFDANQEILYRSRKGRGPGENAAIMRSYDQGVTWEIGPPMPDEILLIHYLYADPTISGRLFIKVIVTGEYADGGGSGCFESMDSGDTWQPIECGELPEEKDVFVKHQLDSYYANAIVADPNNPDILYAGTDGGFFISYDDGKKWVLVNDGLLDGLVIYDVAVDKDRNVYAITPLGVFRLER